MIETIREESEMSVVEMITAEATVVLDLQAAVRAPVEAALPVGEPTIMVGRQAGKARAAAAPRVVLMTAAQAHHQAVAPTIMEAPQREVVPVDRVVGLLGVLAVVRAEVPRADRQAGRMMVQRAVARVRQADITSQRE